MKRALITGCNGQDGSFLAELLIKKNYKVVGLARRDSNDNYLHRLQRVINNKNFILEIGDITDYDRIMNLLRQYKPDEIYHLAAQSQVLVSFKNPSNTFDINFGGTTNIVNAMQEIVPNAKMYFAGTSEMFGNSPAPQSELTEFNPQSPYAEAKLRAYNYIKNMRQEHKLYISCGLMFNHESERRGIEFITRKVVEKVVDMKMGKDNVLIIGNIHAKRDWGYAPDYVRAMHLMLQQDSPDDFVIGTGETRSVGTFIREVFDVAGLNYLYLDYSKWSESHADKKIEELRKNKKIFYAVSHPKFYRPQEVNELCADASKAERVLGWKPATSFSAMIKKMFDAEMDRAR